MSMLTCSTTGVSSPCPTPKSKSFQHKLTLLMKSIYESRVRLERACILRQVIPGLRPGECMLDRHRGTNPLRPYQIIKHRECLSDRCDRARPPFLSAGRWNEPLQHVSAQPADLPLKFHYQEKGAIRLGGNCQQAHCNAENFWCLGTGSETCLTQCELGQTSVENYRGWPIGFQETRRYACSQS